MAMAMAVAKERTQMGKRLRSLIGSCGYSVVRPATVERVIAKRRSADIQALMHAFGLLGLVSLPPKAKRLELVSRLVGTSASEGIFIVDALYRALSVPGDVCEFGVAQGATSALMANEINETNKVLWLYDTFSGLPSPTSEDVLIDDIFSLGSMEAYAGKMSCSEDMVRQRLQDIGFPGDRYKVIKGLFSDQTTDGPSNVAFAYIDFDFYLPIKYALSFVGERASAGTFIAIDDYGFFSAGAAQAVDEFVRESGGRFSMTVIDRAFGHMAVLSCVR